VDIYVGSVKVATVPANTYRNDLKLAGVGNGDHGFTYPTPAAAKTGTAQTVTVDLAGTTTAIGSRTVTCAAPAFGGSFGEADCNQLAGWVWDANQPNSPIDVDVYDGSTLIATFLAGAFRQDLFNAGIGNGDHGFFIPTPASVKTGAAHSVTIKIGGTQTVIGTRSLTCASPAFAGSLDQADCTQLAGWAWDSNQPNDAINVDIYNGVTLLATVPAATFRPDLQSAGIGNGHHGFTFSTEALYTGTTQSLAAYVSGTTIQLASSPRTATCPTEPILTRFFPGGMQSGPSHYFFSYDHLGSLREVTDASGNVVSRYDYDPYGRLTINQGTPPPFGFAHYYYHAPSGLSLTKFRAYDPNLGSWESRDPLADVFGNPYGYAGEDPIDNLDPAGLIWMYSQSSHALSYQFTADFAGQATTLTNGAGNTTVTVFGSTTVPVDDTGYSGVGPGLNNPGYQYVQDVGPASQGWWQVGPPHRGPTDYSLRLKPVNDNHTPRQNLSIHGDLKDPARRFQASHGCIILPLATRKMIWQSGDHLLLVVP
jgi:RHS repeat-associated protein